jgi:hypothetical protein
VVCAFCVTQAAPTLADPPTSDPRIADKALNSAGSIASASRECGSS